MAWHGGEQRTLLQPLEQPRRGFVESFKSSHRLAQSLSKERKLVPGGQTELLQKSQRQHSYVEEARHLPRLPLAAITRQQQLCSDLRRRATSEVVPARESRVNHEASYRVFSVFVNSAWQDHGQVFATRPRTSAVSVPCWFCAVPPHTLCLLWVVIGFSARSLVGKGSRSASAKLRRSVALARIRREMMPTPS